MANYISIDQYGDIQDLGTLEYVASRYDSWASKSVVYRLNGEKRLDLTADEKEEFNNHLKLSRDNREDEQRFYDPSHPDYEGK